MSILIWAVGVYIYTKFVESTYFWQVTTFASYIRPVLRTSCSFNTRNEPISMKNVEASNNSKDLRIAILSIYADTDSTWNDELMDKVISNRVAYCRAHKYDFVNGNSFIDHSRPVAWSKLLLSDILIQYDYVMYMDMDVIIMNASIKIEDFIDASNTSADFVMTNDWSGPNTGTIKFLYINCVDNALNVYTIGVWIVKNSAFSIWFLNKAFDQKQLLQPYAKNGYKHPFEYEQRAFHYLLSTKVWRTRHLPLYTGEYAKTMTDHFSFLSQCSFNSYIVHPFEFRANREESQYAPGDFLVHFAGKKGRIKSDLMEEFLTMSSLSNEKVAV